MLTYDLTLEDKTDFCLRLNSILKSPDAVENYDRNLDRVGELNLMFLTPGIRGTRAKSLLTTRASKNLPTNGGQDRKWVGGKGQRTGTFRKSH